MSLALIRELTTIPVPRVVQVSQTVGRPDWAGSVYLATEYIPGRTLDECWHSLGILSKARIIWTLRDYVAQLRTLKRRAPGPLDKACAFEGYYFSEEGAVPFETYEEMIQWFNRAIEIGNRRPVGKRYDVSPFTASDRLVFLSPRTSASAICYSVTTESCTFLTGNGQVSIPSGWNTQV